MILYSNGCPRCKILESKLRELRLAVVKTDDFSKLVPLGIRSAPVLETDDGLMLDFDKAMNLLRGKTW